MQWPRVPQSSQAGRKACSRHGGMPTRVCWEQFCGAAACATGRGPSVGTGEWLNSRLHNMEDLILKKQYEMYLEFEGTLLKTKDSCIKLVAPAFVGGTAAAQLRTGVLSSNTYRSCTGWRGHRTKN